MPVSSALVVVLVVAMALLAGRVRSSEGGPEGLVLGEGEAVQRVSPVAAPLAGQWLPMRPAPFTPTSFSTGVWTGDVLLVWDHSATGAMFAYDPDYDRWTRLAAPPAAPSGGGHVMVWTGRKVLLWGGVDLLGVPVASGWQFSSIGGWSAIASSPLAGRTGAEGVWEADSGRLVLWGGRGGAHDFPRELEDGAPYDPVADAWGPVRPAATVRAGLTDDDMSGGTPAIDGWRMDSPVGDRVDPVIVTTATELIVWGGREDGTFPRDGARLGLDPP